MLRNYSLCTWKSNIVINLIHYHINLCKQSYTVQWFLQILSITNIELASSVWPHITFKFNIRQDHWLINLISPGKSFDSELFLNHKMDIGESVSNAYNGFPKIS
jgi:hypothetical protein